MWGKFCQIFLILGPTVAFQAVPLSCRQGCHTTRRVSSLYSDSTDADELSKLIGKRAEIKRKSKEEIEEEPLPPEPVVDLDLDKLPQFKTDRPVRRAKKKEESEGQDEKDTKKSADTPIVDFKADYDDENDLHIPNRIGVSTKHWGDPKAGFVASGKLTKRMIKEGKFVPGDLQLAHSKLLEGGM